MRPALTVTIGILLGVVILAAARFVFVPVERPTHYHANFAIFAHGQRIDLSADRYMEELAGCTMGEDTILPTARVHLHDNNPDVVHVHHQGVTWGHLVANLGFGLGDRYLMIRDRGLLTEGKGKTLKFILNGRPELSVHNQLIRSGDRLLISYGPENEEEILRSQFSAVASNAKEYNLKSDPAGCSGSTEPTLWERIRYAFAG